MSLLAEYEEPYRSAYAETAKSTMEGPVFQSCDFIQAGADPNLVALSGTTPLDVAKADAAKQLLAQVKKDTFWPMKDDMSPQQNVSD